MQRPAAPALRARAPTATAAAPHRPPGRCAVPVVAVSGARPRRPVVAARASSDNESTTPKTDLGNRRAALACGCAACAFALLGAAVTRPGTAAASAAANNPYLSRERGGAYDEYFAKAMGTMQVYETEVAGLKRQLFGELARDLFEKKKKRRRQRADDDDKPITLLELGVGRGPNFQVLAEAVREAGGDVSRGDVRVVGVDPNPAMLPYARESADSAGFPRESVELRALYGEQLKEAFGQGPPFDAAIVTLVLCSVPDVPRTLAELKGVVRSGRSGGGGDESGGDESGRLLLIEHVRDPNPKSLRRLGQVLLSPLQRALADGCNLDRDTEAELRRAGLLGERAENERRLRRLEVDGLGLLAPHLAGVLEV